jgi:hypothetical protein
MSPSYSYITIVIAVEDILCLDPADRVVAEYTYRYRDRPEHAMHLKCLCRSELFFCYVTISI